MKLDRNVNPNEEGKYALVQVYSNLLARLRLNLPKLKQLDIEFRIDL